MSSFRLSGAQRYRLDRIAYNLRYYNDAVTNEVIIEELRLMQRDCAAHKRYSFEDWLGQLLDNVNFVEWDSSPSKTRALMIIAALQANAILIAQAEVQFEV